MPINFYPCPTLDKETRIIMNRDGWKWQRETGEKQSATCLQMDGGHAHYVDERE
ncbi:hypothetical protein [Neobacillus soli]|uniref:hypothetical protein n=1 Tax=Neobacillus soli TaxID=220688 RepID=UPI0012ED9544|nr:hypothetical protein [Neobacillus soli]